MDAAIEDALVEWYETECQARTAAADARRCDVIDLESVRQRQNPALARLFGVVEKTIESLSLLQSAAAVDCRQQRAPYPHADARVHA